MFQVLCFREGPVTIFFSGPIFLFWKLCFPTVFVAPNHMESFWYVGSTRHSGCGFLVNPYTPSFDGWNQANQLIHSSPLPSFMGGFRVILSVHLPLDWGDGSMAQGSTSWAALVFESWWAETPMEERTNSERITRWWFFKYVLMFNPIPGEMIQVHSYFFRWGGSTTN